MTQKERRKHPRYSTKLEVIFYDQRRTKGHIVDISKKGCMMALKDGATRPVGSLITFRVFFEGKAQLEENTMPSISLADLDKKKAPPKPTIDRYPHAVKVLAIVVRHLKYEEKPAMGIQIKDMNDEDLIKWNRFMDKINIEQLALPEKKSPPAAAPTSKPIQQNPPVLSQELPTYTLKFKSVDAAARFLPQTETESFFIPSKEQAEGTPIRVALVHPATHLKMEFIGIVQMYGTDPNNNKTNGIFATFQNLDVSLKHQINTFLGQHLYEY